MRLGSSCARLRCGSDHLGALGDGAFRSVERGARGLDLAQRILPLQMNQQRFRAADMIVERAVAVGLAGLLPPAFMFLPWCQTMGLGKLLAGRRVFREPLNQSICSSTAGSARLTQRLSLIILDLY